ncbi:tripartite tricarboxylate transporter TctB family protein [Pseudothermotoga thermarum]|uniref:Putative tricarboxylic transport membrane protein n=1 Tax=Pseudothermotoga thermarum DSM 5069 TaxID=688269 RepID=F7YYQ4_9THEM|nr:tripartite tricarboxylate transporter TctB family protein [Pseudothermotoga thermarum]AEH51089.1 putative tricarboxylic transport membrane protein [Pseudothermotoga thermarum DSM 5069]
MSIKVGFKNSDFLSGLVIFVIGLVFYLDTLSIKPAKIGLSPASFPQLITICLMICGIGLAIKGLFVKPQLRQTFKLSVLKKIAFLGVMFFLYVFLLDKLGFLIVTPFLIFGTIYLFGGRKFLLNVLVSVLSTIVIYYVFTQVFKVLLPSFSL